MSPGTNENNNESRSFGIRTDAELSLSELGGIVWARKVGIFSFTIFCSILVVWYALLIPNEYKAKAVLAPAQKQSSGLGSTLGQLGGLASLAGVNMTGVEANESQIAQEVMQSWNFIDNFINENDLAVQLLASERWDKQSNQLSFDTDLYDLRQRKWLIEDEDEGGLREPSSWELFSRFSEMLVVTEDKKTDLVSVSITFYSPFLAKKWVDMYVDAINQHMQSRQVSKVTNNIEYLQAQIEKTQIAEMKDVFYNIIQEQIKNKMIAEASPEYVFVAVSPSMIPEEKSSPRRVIICVLGSVLGGVFALLWVVLSHVFRR